MKVITYSMCASLLVESLLVATAFCQEDNAVAGMRQELNALVGEWSALVDTRL